MCRASLRRIEAVLFLATWTDCPPVVPNRNTRHVKTAPRAAGIITPPGAEAGRGSERANPHPKE